MMTITALQQPHQDASARLNANIDRIMTEWSKQVKEQVPSAGALNKQQLYDGLVAFLKTLANVISTTPSSDGGERFAIENSQLCRVHGKMRAGIPGYTLDQVISEYRVLRMVIFSILEEDTILTKNEQLKILQSIDNGMTEAATEFTLLLGFPWSRQFKEMETEIQQMRSQRTQNENLMTTLAHDLRTPLTAAKMRAELILKEPKVSGLVEAMASKLVTDIERTDRMIKDLLDVSLLRAGEKLPLKLTESNLRAITKSTLNQLQDIYGNRFLLQGERTILGIWDPDAIRRILENLCTNAIKYGSPDGIVIVILTETEKTVELSIHNEGKPLTPAEQELIFRQFRRGKKPRGSTADSRGIGLTIVRGLAEAHSGTVDVESSLKTGTTFRVTLPRITKL